MQSKSVTVVIVNWNTMEMLQDCLTSLRDCDGYEHMKVIVVDNDSHDNSREMVASQFSEVVVINSRGNIGFARANNLAIPEIDTPFVLYLNPDTIVMHKSVRLMMDFMISNPNVGAVGCKMKWPDGRTQPLGLQWFPSPITELISIMIVSSNSTRYLKRLLPYKNPEKSDYVSKLYGGCLMVRKSILDKVGYFDERFFMYGEDVDLCRRIRQEGWNLYYLSEAEVIHLCGGASEKAISQFSTLMKCESISKLMEKYYGTRGLCLYKLTVFIGSQIRLLLLSFLKLLWSVTSPRNKSHYDESFSKYKAMMKWSLNLQKPVIKE